MKKIYFIFKEHFERRSVTPNLGQVGLVLLVKREGNIKHTYIKPKENKGYLISFHLSSSSVSGIQNWILAWSYKLGVQCGLCFYGCSTNACTMIFFGQLREGLFKSPWKQAEPHQFFQWFDLIVPFIQILFITRHCFGRETRELTLYY